MPLDQWTLGDFVLAKHDSLLHDSQAASHRGAITIAAIRLDININSDHVSYGPQYLNSFLSPLYSHLCKRLYVP